MSEHAQVEVRDGEPIEDAGQVPPAWAARLAPLLRDLEPRDQARFVYFLLRALAEGGSGAAGGRQRAGR